MLRNASGNALHVPHPGTDANSEPAGLVLPWAWLAAAYVPLWALAASASDAFWFLPAGLRLTLVWLTPRDRLRLLWPIEAAAVGLAVLMAGSQPPYNQVSLPAAGLLLVVNLLGPLACYLGAVWLTSARGARAPRMQSRDVERLLAAALLGSISSSLLFAVRDQWLAWSTGQAMSPMPWVFAIGDFVGCLVVAPLLLALLCSGPHSPTRPRRLRLLVLGLLPALLAGLGNTLQGDERLLVLVLGLAALLLVAHANGWRTAALGVTALSAVAHLLPLASALSISPWVLQIGVAAVGSGALLLGGSVESLRERIAQALRLSTEVQQARSELQAAAGRLVASGEAERQRLARDLHDGLGQSLTALRTRTHLLRRGLCDPFGSEGLVELDSLATLAQDELRAVLDAVNPVELERLGFARALAHGSIAGMLADSGIAFDCQIMDGLELGPTEAAHLYRICQEAASNVARAGKARQFGVQLRREGEALLLELSDDGGSIRIDTGSGQGLQSIRDRATALGADYAFDASTGLPRHRLKLPRSA